MRIGGKLIYPELSYEINGILFGIHNELGRFCNEKQYCDAIEQHLKDHNFNYAREAIIPPSFQDELKGRNRVDFMIDDKIILEIKVKRFLEKEDYYQALRYLKACNKKLAVIINFRDKYIRPKRIINGTASE